MSLSEVSKGLSRNNCATWHFLLQIWLFFSECGKHVCVLRVMTLRNQPDMCICRYTGAPYFAAISAMKVVSTFLPMCIRLLLFSGNICSLKMFEIQYRQFLVKQNANVSLHLATCILLLFFVINSNYVHLWFAFTIY